MLLWFQLSRYMAIPSQFLYVQAAADGQLAAFD